MVLYRSSLLTQMVNRHQPFVLVLKRRAKEDRIERIGYGLTEDKLNKMDKLKISVFVCEKESRYFYLKHCQ
jgi:hypothetical protein